MFFCRFASGIDFQKKNTILHDSITIFIGFHKKQQKPLCFSVVSHPAEPDVSIFIAKVKSWLRKHAKSTVFFDFSNHPKAQVPIFSVQKSIFAHIPGSSGSPGNGARTATSDHPNNAPGVKMTEVLTNSLKLHAVKSPIGMPSVIFLKLYGLHTVSFKPENFRKVDVLNIVCCRICVVIISRLGPGGGSKSSPGIWFRPDVWPRGPISSELSLFFSQHWAKPTDRGG